MQRYWSSGITKRLNTDTKHAAVTVHTTGSAVGCSSNKDGLIMKLPVTSHQTVTLGDRNWVDNMRDLFGQYLAVMGVDIAV